MKKLFLTVALMVYLLSTAVYSQDYAFNITFWYFLPEKQSEILNTVVQSYREKHPNIGITLKRFESGSALHSALVKPTETLPDIALIDSSWQKELIAADKMVPVEDAMLPAVKVVAKMDTYKPLWNACTYDGKLWSMPYFAFNRALVYNPKMFQEKKITKPPTNWKELLEIADKLSDPAKGIYGFYVPVNDSDKDLAYFYQIFLLQAGGAAYNPETEGLNGEFAERALYYLYDLVNTHKVSPDGKSNIDKYKTAMFIGTPNDILEAKKQGVELKVVRWPITSKFAGDIDVASFAVMNKPGVNAEQAWGLIYHLVEFPQLSKMVVDIPVFPSNKQVTLSPQYFEYLERHPALRTFMALLDKGNVKPSITNYEFTMSEFGKAMKEALNKQNSVNASLVKAMDAVNKEVKPGVAPPPPTGKNTSLTPAPAAKPAAPATKTQAPAAKPAVKK